jgi:hypothetical protein
MNINNQRTGVTLLLLLFQSIHLLVTPYVQVHKISFFRNKGAFPKDPYSFPTRRTAANLQRYGFTKYPTLPSSPSAQHVMTPGRRRVGAESYREILSSNRLDSFIRDMGLVLASLTTSLMQSIRKYWWCFPMLLALVPPYCVLFKGSFASMPDWWSVVNMDHIAASDNANWIIAPFLGSNVAYALSGIYLMKQFRFFDISESGSLVFRPTKFSMLGVWVLIAGLISTIFHSVQALGSYALAESLCYLDHAVAGSAVFYFFDTCGVPSKMTSLIGTVAMFTLVVTTPSYAWLHSSWHYLSAATATQWALDGYSRISE